MGMDSIPDIVRTRREKLDAGLVERSIIVPIGKVLPVTQRVLTDRQVRELLEAADPVAVTDCGCRAIEGRCDAPRDVCILLGETAKNNADNPIYRPVTTEEALAVLDRASESGLVHLSIWSQGHVPQAICNCCPCCCSELRAMSEFGFHDHVISSDFVAVHDAGACTGCGTCADRCGFGAIVSVDGSIELVRERCFGCGLCALTCPSGALSLERRD